MDDVDLTLFSKSCICQVDRTYEYWWDNNLLKGSKYQYCKIKPDIKDNSQSSDYYVYIGDRIKHYCEDDFKSIFKTIEEHRNNLIDEII